MGNKATENIVPATGCKNEPDLERFSTRDTGYCDAMHVTGCGAFSGRGNWGTNTETTELTVR